MDRAFESGAVAIPPTVPAVPSVGFPTGGNPVGGVPATKPGAHWFHMVTEELRALIVAGGLTPSPSVLDQLLQALPGALASRPDMARSLAGSGYQRLPGGLILQWGQVSPPGSHSFPIAFPNECFVVAITSNAATARYPTTNARPFSTTGFTSFSSDGSSIQSNYIAIGR